MVCMCVMQCVSVTGLVSSLGLDMVSGVGPGFVSVQVAITTTPVFMNTVIVVICYKSLHASPAVDTGNELDHLFKHVQCEY